MNKGVKSKNSAENNGTLNPEQSPVFIDFLKLRVNDVEAPNPYFEMIAVQLLKYKLFISHIQCNRSRGYDCAYKIVTTNQTRNVVGKIEYSQRYKRVLLEFTGLGCACIEKVESDYRWLQALIGQQTVTIRRIDLALDDENGLYQIEKIDKDYSRGRFNSQSGKRPKKENLGTKIEGRTRYIGGPTAYKRGRFYEKGKQLKLTHCRPWMRHEVRFVSNDRDRIPDEAIRNRADYFYSAFPKALRKLLGKHSVISVTERFMREYVSDISTRVANCKRQYGPLIGTLTEHHGERATCDMLTRVGRNRVIELPPFVDNVSLSEYTDVIALQSSETI
jgi:phage replication initiation protein